MAGELACFPPGSPLKRPQNFLKLNRFIVLISTCENNRGPHKNVESMPNCLWGEGEGRKAEEGRDRTRIIQRAVSLLAC